MLEGAQGKISISSNDDIAEEIKRTEQNQEEGPETKTFESSRKVRNPKNNENEQETEKSKSMIETGTGKGFFYYLKKMKITIFFTEKMETQAPVPDQDEEEGDSDPGIRKLEGKKFYNCFS